MNKINGLFQQKLLVDYDISPEVGEKTDEVAIFQPYSAITVTAEDVDRSREFEKSMASLLQSLFDTISKIAFTKIKRNDVTTESLTCKRLLHVKEVGKRNKR